MSRRVVNITFGLLLLVVVLGGAAMVHVAAAGWLYSSFDRGHEWNETTYVTDSGAKVSKQEREAQLAMQAGLFAFGASIPAGIGLLALWGVAFGATRMFVPPDGER